MWFSLALAVIAVTAGTRDFPELVNVMFDICGQQKFDLTPAYPCQFRIFGLSLAWQECANAYQADMEGFRSCVDGCVSPGMCGDACTGLAKNATQHEQQQCHAECSMVTACVDQALTQATGQVSAASDVRKCFQGRTNYGTSSNAAVGGAAPQGAVVQWAGPNLRGVSTLAVAKIHHRVTPGAVASQGDCACDSTGVVRDVQTGQGGCRRHGQEPQASKDWYCYIAGGMECPGAMPSRQFVGLHWLGCAGPFEHFAQLFPPRCRLLEFGFAPQDQPLQTPKKPTGQGTLQLGTPVSPEPRFQEQVEGSIRNTLDAAVPLPAEWHAQHGDVFLKPRGTPPEPGQPLPAALSTPLWWELAQRPAETANGRGPKAEPPAGVDIYQPFNDGFWPGGAATPQKETPAPDLGDWGWR